MYLIGGTGFLYVRGDKVTLYMPEEKHYVTLDCDDGTLGLLDYSFVFEIENQETWQNLLRGMTGDLDG